MDLTVKVQVMVIIIIFNITLLLMDTFVQTLMNVPAPMDNVSTTVPTQMVATIVHVLIQLGIPSVKMDTVVLVCAQLNKLLQLDKNAHTTAPCV